MSASCIGSPDSLPGAESRSSETLRRVSDARDPRLDTVIQGLEETGWAAEVCDAEWRLIWVSSNARTLIGQDDDGDLGLGKHVLESRQHPAWQRLVSLEAQEQWVRLNVPQMLVDDPGSGERLAA